MATYLIINSDTKEIAQEHNSKHIAEQECVRLNKNEELPVYYISPTCPQCYSEETVKLELEDNKWLCCNCRYTFKS